MEGWVGPRVWRSCQLHWAGERCAVWGVGVAYACLHPAVGRAAAHIRHLRGYRVSRQISDARFSARPFHFADDGNASRDRFGVDDDVPPATRYPQLPLVAGRPAAAALGVSPRDRDSFAGHGRDLAMDAAGDADRARWISRDPGRAL